MMKTSPLIVLLALLIYPFITNATAWHDPAACNNAEQISCGTSLNNETNSGYTNKLDNYQCGADDIVTGYKGPERIYRFTLSTRQNVQIVLDDIQGQGTAEINYDLFLMSGTCEARRCVTSSTNGRTGAESIDAQLEPGEYYIIVDTWENEIGTFDLRLNCASPPTPPSCDGSLWIKCGVRVEGNTRRSDNDYDNDDYTCLGGKETYAGGDDIYAFEKKRPNDVIQFHLFTDNPDLNIILVNQCDRNGFRCLLSGKSFSGGKYIDEGNFGMPTGLYYVIVDGAEAGDHAEYELMLTCGTMDVDFEPLGCGAFISQEDLGQEENNWAIYNCGRKQGERDALTGPDKSYDFTVTETTEYTITVSSVDNYDEVEVFLFEEGVVMPQCAIIGTKSNGVITIQEVLTPGRYIVSVDGKQAGKYDISLSGCPCKADGVLECETPVDGSNVGGGNNISRLDGACFVRSVSTAAQDRIYEFTAPESKRYTFLLYNMTRDLDLFLLSDCDESGRCLGYSRKSGNEVVSIELEEGETIYALVDGFGRLVESDFTIRVSCVEDLDQDGIPDADDNCPDTPNEDQANNDDDDFGDVCDNDDDNDGVLDDVDCAPFDADKAFSIGDVCNDNNPLTIDDTVNSDCECVGVLDTDQDGVIDANDDCPNTPTGATVNDAGCSDADGDGFFPGGVGSSFDPDDMDMCNPDSSSAECQPIIPTIQLSIENATGALGDTVCFDISATDFDGVAAASFSINIDPQIANIISVSNISLVGGTFTGSGSAMTGSGTMTGSGSGGTGFVVWSADGGSPLDLGVITPIVEVCAEITSDDFDKATVSITNDPVSIEFLDAMADTIAYVAGEGLICRDTTVTAMAMIQGEIVNIAGRSLPNVEVALSGDMTMADMTSGDGAYAFEAAVGGDYNITPMMTPDLMVQVSLLDVLMLRKHLIYRTSLTEPYQYVAADIDGSGHLSVRDELLMKMMILGLDNNRFPYWRFVKSDHEFAEVADFTLSGEVFDYPSSTSVNALSDDMSQDFIGVRMGDLQLEDMEASSRSLSKVSGDIANVMMQSGEEVTIPISLNRETNMAALMLRADIDLDRFDVVDIQAGLALDKDATVDYNVDNQGRFTTIVFNSFENNAIDAHTEMISVTLRAKQTGLLVDGFQLSPESELISSDLTTSAIEWNVSSAILANTVSVSPNPFSAEATLSIQSVSDAAASRLTIYDNSGRVVHDRAITITRGLNEIKMNKTSLGLHTGAHYIEVKIDGEVINNKILVVE